MRCLHFVKISLVATGEMLLEEYKWSCKNESSGGCGDVRNRLYDYVLMNLNS